jgi:hypothetical protein
MNLSHWKGRLSVLLMDSSEAIGNSYKPTFESIFKEAGYDAEVAVYSPSALPDDYFEKAYVDVIICDVSLGADMSDNLGLETMKVWKSVHPGIFSIVYTNHRLDYASHSKYPFDLFISKPALSNQEHRLLVIEKLRDRLKLNTSAYLSAASGHAVELLTPQELLDLNRTIRKITYTGVNVGVGARVTRVTLSTVSGGYSDSIVFRMQSFTDTDFGCVQALLKVALKRRSSAWRSLEAELRNYDQYVRWYLPYYWRPEILGEGDEGSIKAICYAFVSARDEEFRTLSASIRKNDLASVDVAIESIFNPTFQRWYHPHNVETEERLCDFYNAKCGGSDPAYSRQQKFFEKEVRDLDSIGDRYLRMGTEAFKWPHLCLISPPSPKYQSCIVHGDLNTRNIFVSHSHETKEVTLIDFSETGRGHVYFDFIAFEVNFRLDLVDTEDRSLSSLILEERAINAYSDEGDFAIRSIMKLRTYAAQNFPGERMENYLYGLATYCYGLLNASNLSEKERRRLVACICAALLDLEAIDFWAFCNTDA